MAYVKNKSISNPCSGLTGLQKSTQTDIGTNQLRNEFYELEPAEVLDVILNEFNQKVDLIISLSVPREIIEKRIIGRVTCEKCNLTLNEFFNVNEIKLHPCGSSHFLKRNLCLKNVHASTQTRKVQQVNICICICCSSHGDEERKGV